MCQNLIISVSEICVLYLYTYTNMCAVFVYVSLAGSNSEQTAQEQQPI
jgi:hypothetical protein